MSDVQITLTHDETIVWFDVLTRYSQPDKLGTGDHSEQRALGDLQCVLERILPEVLEPEYRTLLATAQ